MRLQLVFLVFSVIYFASVNGQHGYMASNGGYMGSTNGYMPSTGFRPTGNRPNGNVVTRFFGNIFGAGRTAKQNSEVADPLTREDFQSQLPKKPTDKMINDALAQHIVTEGRAQESVGSPFIVSPEDSTAADKQPKLTVNSKENQLNKVTSSDRDGKSIANQATDKIPIVEALRIVNTSNLGDCVARVICELSCNANAYGNSGRTVFRNLIKLQFDQNIKSDDAKFFRQAAAKGRQIVQAKKDCSECYTIYSSCKSDSKDLVAVSSMFKL